jgi:hypothetical protein
MQVEILLMVIWLLAIAAQLLWKFLVDALVIHMTNFMNHPINYEEVNVVKILTTVEDQVIGLNDEG